jgi:hypothetical protein
MNQVTAETAKQLYAGKYFYEVVKTERRNEFTLLGPFDNIRYAVPHYGHPNETGDVAFVQVIDGKVVQSFSDSEILVLDRKL